MTDKRSPRRQRHAPTIADVARHANVSPMTVSRVINGEQGVRAPTRDKVETAIAALNYSPSAAARSLAGGEEMRIALLHSNPSAAYLSEFLVGGLDQARRNGAHLLVEKWDEAAGVAEVVGHMLRGRIDGVVLPPPLCDLEPLVQALADAKIATVAVATGRTRDDLASVSIDDFAAARQMTAHLVGLGHRRIGFIKGHPNQSASDRRLEGYAAALGDAGLSMQDNLIAQGYFTYQSGMTAACTLLGLPEPPSAIFASNDDMAAATVAVAHRKGLAVPGDLTVCGFDDTALATTIWPELTTVRQPISAMSRAAMEQLVQMLRARRNGRGDPASHIVMGHQLVRRQSDAPPKS